MSTSMQNMKKKTAITASTSTIATAATPATAVTTATTTATTATTKSSNIEDIPFYRAVALYEAEKYQEALSLFLQPNLQGNLYAQYYLDHLSKNSANLGLKIIAEQKKMIENALEYFKMIPQQYHPAAWFKASQAIIALRKAVAKNDRAAARLAVSELKDLSKNASNATVALLRLYKENPLFKPNMKKASDVTMLVELAKQLQNHADLYALHYQAQHHLLAPESVNNKEWQFVTKFCFTKNTSALIESLVAKEYNDVSAERRSSLGRNVNLAYRWLITAAHMGNNSILMEIGKDNMPTQEAEKKLWTLWAAINHNLNAELDIARMYCRGDIPGFSQHYPRARQFFEKALAADKREKLRKNYPNELFSDGLQLFGTMHKGGLGGLAKSEGEALKYFQEAAALNNANAHYFLSHYHLHGEAGLPANAGKALEHCVAALSIFSKYPKENQTKGVMDVMTECHNRMGAIYHAGGIGVTQDFSKALQYFQLAADRLPRAKRNMGSMIFYGEGVEQDKNRGLQMMYQAAIQGDALAALDVLRQVIFWENTSLNINDDTLKKLLTLAEAANLKKALDLSVCYYFKQGEYRECYPYLLRGEKLDRVQALTILGEFYYSGCSDLSIKPDEVVAIQYCRRAAELGSANAMYNLGVFLYKTGIDKNIQESRTWFEKALEKGYLDAAYNLFQLYRKGAGVSEDPKKAFEYLKQAEDTKDKDVYCELFLCYSEGLGTSPNDRMAHDYAMKAVEAGNPELNYGYAKIMLFLAITHHKQLNVSTYNLLHRSLGYASELELPEVNLFKIVLKYFLDASEKDKVKRELEDAQLAKPFNQYEIALKWLAIEDKKTPLRLLCLILDRMDVLDKIDKQNQSVTTLNEVTIKDNVIEDDKPTTSIMPTPMLPVILPTILPVSQNSTAVIQDVNNIPKKNAANTSQIKNDFESRLIGKVMASIQGFTERNLKAVDFADFTDLIKKVIQLPGITGKISSSKGSNVKFHVNIPNAKPVRFSYHPKHSAGRGKDAAFDPNRSQSLKEKAMEVYQNLSANVASLASSSGVSSSDVSSSGASSSRASSSAKFKQSKK